jgi:hypothetical protein
MAMLDIFKDDAFGLISLTDALNKQDFQPTMMRSLNLFTPRPVRTKDVAIEEKDGVLNVIRTSQRGAPVGQRETQKRRVRSFEAPRIATSDTIWASEIAGIRQFGSETEFAQVQSEVAERMNGPAGLMRNIEMTWENMALGAVQGVLVDEDGSTIYNWFDEFGVTQAAEIDFDLDAASPVSGAVWKKCFQVRQQMRKAAKGAWSPNSMVGALCGESFWRDLIAHSEIQKTYELQAQAGDLQSARTMQGMPDQLVYGKIMFMYYAGTDDDSTIAVDADKCKFFPMNAPGAFQVALTPGEWFDVVNQPGQDVYAMTIPDRDRNAFVSLEVYSYPLYICTRPAMLQRAKRT